VVPINLAADAAVRIVNGFGRTLNRLGLPPVRLNDEALLERARRQTRLDDFGTHDFRGPLRLLLRSLEHEARLSWLGRILARNDVCALLANRLRLVRDRSLHPEIAEGRVASPLFVAGLPRTGSTLLHHLLAQDPNSRVLRAWEVLAPSPPPDPAGEGTDPRIAAARRQFRWFDRIAPDFKTIHPLGAELPLECIALLAHSFLSSRFNTSYRVPSYQAWFEQQDQRPAYELHRAILQHLQVRFPGARWVLKAPTHLWSLEPLFATYPDAIVVQTHRDPATVLASVASLTAVLRGVFSEAVDPLEIGREVTHQWSNGLERALQFRRSRAVAAERFVDVQYRDLLRDPIELIRVIYARVGWTLDGEAERRMRAHLASHPKDLHGPHRYSLESFGLDPGAIAHRFKTYREYFDVKEENVVG
jgi:hypothetical protein